MSEGDVAPASTLPPDPVASGRPPSSAPGQRRQVVLITLGAIAIYLGLRALPTGTNLSHMDFRASGGTSIEFCDPGNPQFIPVVAVRSPVAMTFATKGRLAAGSVAVGTVSLHTASGKPIAPEDLLVVHTQKLHLLIADESLTDYQHVHPVPGAAAGDWNFSFTPRFGGKYRIFADFTPVATGRGLYASVDAPVEGARASVAPPPARLVVEQEGIRFALTPGALPLRSGQPIDLRFTMTASGGGAVPLQPVMGAFAHLVAFDAARSGFAHLHPMETDLSKPPDRVQPVFNFKLTIPKSGRYVIWAQVNLGGRETFVPFWFDVE